MDTNDKNFTDPWERDSYETGSTNPPKKRGGIIAVLLVIVIFLGGFTRALSLLNIRLFQQQPHTGTSFLSSDADLGESCVADRPHPGFTGETVSALHQRFYQYPAGVLVKQVRTGSSAAAQGVADGDILLSLDGTQMADVETLNRFLLSHKPGDTVAAVFYRAGEQYHCSIILSDPNN